MEKEIDLGRFNFLEATVQFRSVMWANLHLHAQE